jgi:serine/threonine protein kinase
MATIYRVKDVVSKTLLALKMMDEAYLNDKDLVEKFFKEGQVISEINREYPNVPVVKVFRYGRENTKTWGRPFIAMELLKGPNLLQFIKTNRNLHPIFIMKILKQLGEALHAAHIKGVYHRDITPDNIILINNDPFNPVIRLIDFGVARHEYTAAGTLDGSIAGKPAYMSPEQCRGEKVDGRSDIYSMGIVFYTLLTGTPPFISNNPLEVMTHHQRTPVPPLPGRVSPQISQIVLKMLKKDKNERYSSVSHLLTDLSRLLQEAS